MCSREALTHCFIDFISSRGAEPGALQTHSRSGGVSLCPCAPPWTTGFLGAGPVRPPRPLAQGCAAVAPSPRTADSRWGVPGAGRAGGREGQKAQTQEAGVPRGGQCPYLGASSSPGGDESSECIQGASTGAPSLPQTSADCVPQEGDPVRAAARSSGTVRSPQTPYLLTQLSHCPDSPGGRGGHRER